MAEEDDKPKATYEELEAEVNVLRATIRGLGAEIRKRDEQLAEMRRTPRPTLELDPQAKDRFRRPIRRGR